MHASVVAAIDDIPRGFEVARVAEHLAAALDLSLVLAHVPDEPHAANFGDRAGAERERAAAHDHAVDLLEELVITLELPERAEVRVEHGPTADLLAEIAETENAELVVAGSRGRGKIRSALLGSVTGELVGNLRCPLVVVPPGAGVRYASAWERADVTIVCGVDGDGSAARVVASADRLAGRLQAGLHLVHVGPALPAGVPAGMMGAPVPMTDVLADQEREKLELLHRAAQHMSQAPRAAVSVKIGDPAATLADVAEQDPAMMVVVTTDSPWQRLAGSAGVPVAVVPDGDHAPSG